MDKRQNAPTNSNDLKLVTEIKILARIENNEIYILRKITSIPHCQVEKLPLM